MTAFDFVAIIAPLLIGVFGVAVFHRKLTYPEKTLWNCFLSVGLAPLRLLRLGPYSRPVTLKNAMESAMKSTKLSDFGDMTFAANYSVVLDGTEQSKLEFHNIGYLMAQLELNITMERRLKFIQYLKDSPDVLNVRVNKPVFVVGLPRTGTTFLHRLLSLDPHVRAPLLWELLSPVPGVTAKGGAGKAEFIADSKRRESFVKAQIKKRQDAGDRALEHIHEIGYDVPEECLMAMSDEIPCLTQNFYAAYMDMPAYFSQIGSVAVKRCYVQYKKVLQLLAYQIGDTDAKYRWMLKSPIHLFYIKELATAFPDATIIWTHRHPVSAVPSLCSLLKAVHKVYYEQSTHDDARLGKAVRDLSADLLHKTPTDIAESGLASANVVYDSFIADPIGTVRALYSQLGWTFTGEYEAILKQHLAEDQLKRKAVKSKRGSGAVLHKYTPEEFSITTQDLTDCPYFAEYVRKFNIPMSVN